MDQKYEIHTSTKNIYIYFDVVCRFCVGDRFYLCDNKILCEYDYEERLVFANMAYNPSSLAHIRRQVSSLQVRYAVKTAALQLQLPIYPFTNPNVCVFLKLTRIFTFCEHTKPPPCAALPVEPAVVRPQHNPCTDTDGRPRIQLWHTRCH